MNLDRQIAQLRRRLAELDKERTAVEAALNQLEQKPVSPASLPATASHAASKEPNALTNASPAASKIALFRKLFAGRTDVFPVRWENRKNGKSGYAPACANEWVRHVCGKPKVRCGDCPNQSFILVSDAVIECHLRGQDRIRPNGRGKDFVAGVYPLLFDDTCHFLAVDFDDKDWSLDALAFLETARSLGIPAAFLFGRLRQNGDLRIPNRKNGSI